jgi:putative nucleotidyltransferase with HDIG domain
MFEHQYTKKILSFWRQPGAIRRFSLYLLFVAVVALFLHLRYEYSERLELNTIAEKYVIARTAFAYPDEDATEILRHQASRDIGDIFCFPLRHLETVFQEITTELTEDFTWRQILPVATFEELLQGIYHLRGNMQAVRFTDERTIHKINQLLGNRDSELFQQHFRVANTPTEFQDLWASDQFWQSLWGEMSTTAVPQEVQQFLLGQVRKRALPLQHDRTLQKLLQEKIQDMVSQQWMTVDAGSPLVEPGQKITKRHLRMLATMYDVLARDRRHWDIQSSLGSLLLAAVFLVLFLGYLKNRAQDLYASLLKTSLLFAILMGAMTFGKGLEYYLSHQGRELLPFIHFAVVAPCASLLICMLLGTEVAIFSTGILSVLMALSLSATFAFDRLLAINVITGVIAILYSRRMRKRAQVFSVCARLFLLTLPVLIAFDLSLTEHFLRSFVGDALTLFISLVLTGVIVVGILPILEKVFGLITDITLMQLLDPNHPLLRRLSLEAPGTYQHCLVVGNLAEAAAHAIGANGLFCRVSALYHDIGKLFNPNYFTENQFSGFNIHQLLTPRESAQVIMSHVTEGESMARKYGLPVSFIRIIREHHGTSLVSCFYYEHLKLSAPEVAAVDERLFRYKGPKPHSRESAIVMIADTVEAAARTLEEISESTLMKMIEEILHNKIQDGQFDECRLSFEELTTIKKALIKTLSIAHHMRIKYPKPEKLIPQPT